MELPRPRSIVVQNILNATPFNQLQIELKQLKKWEPTSDVWAIRYGTQLLSVTTSAAAIYINIRFRRRLKLLSAGYFMSFVSVTAAPGIMTSLLYPTVILEKIVVDTSACQLCIKGKAIIIQTLAGTVYPLALAPIINLAAAMDSGSRVPGITEVRKLGMFFYSVCKPMLPNLIAFAICNSIFTAYIVNRQFSQMERVRTVRMLQALSKEDHH